MNQPGRPAHLGELDGRLRALQIVLYVAGALLIASSLMSGRRRSRY
jgi:hypothetical protein